MRQFRLNAIICLQLPVIALSIVSSLAAQSPSPPSATPQPAQTTPAQPAPDAKPAPITNIDQVTVTAYRAPLGVLESPVTTRLLTEPTTALHRRHHLR